METYDLKIEQLNLLVKSFREGFEFGLDSKHIDIIEEFVPKMFKQTQYEITRCNVGDVIMILESYYKLWDLKVLKGMQMESIYKLCEEFLDQYLAQNKKDITGS